MKAFGIFTLSFFFSSYVLAVNPYHIRATSEMPICDDSYVELKNLPPVRDQGPYGLCYAHSSINLLDHMLCKDSPLGRNCYEGKGSVLHLARYYNTQSEDYISQGGVAREVMTRFQNVKELAKESCASYEDWTKLDRHYADEKGVMDIPESEQGEIDYFYYLSKQINQGKASTEQKICWAQEILDAGVRQSFEDVLKILNSSQGKDWRELRYQILVPRACREEKMTYPNYSISIYPKNARELKTYEGIRNYIHRSLKADAMVEASICSSVGSDGKCNFHSVSVVGQRQVCDEKGCKEQFRLLNSYGRSWQEAFDNGWVDAENFANNVGPRGLMSILPDGKSLDEKLIAPRYSTSPIQKEMVPQSLALNGKDSLGSSDRCYKVQSAVAPIAQENEVDKEMWTIPEIPEPTVQPRRGVIYFCEGNGKTTYSGIPTVAGMVCKEWKGQK